MCLNSFQEQVLKRREDEGIKPEEREAALLIKGSLGSMEKMRVAEINLRLYNLVLGKVFASANRIIKHRFDLSFQRITCKNQPRLFLILIF